jgi:hypothetical protein
MSHHHPHNNKEPWWQEAWQPAAAAVYLFICLLDFGVMPLIYEWINASMSNSALVDLALKFTNPAAQIEALQALKVSRVWVPLTLQGNGMFHIAFGAILGVGAFAKGQEKVAWASVGLPPGGYPNGYPQMGGFGNQNFGGMGNMPTNFGNQVPNNGMTGLNGMPNGQFNNVSNNMNKPATPMPAVNAGPSVDVVNPDDNNE